MFSLASHHLLTSSSSSRSSSSPSSMALLSLPPELLAQIAFFYTCPHVLGPPVSLTPFLLICKDIYERLTGRSVHNSNSFSGRLSHLYARVFRYKYSFTAIRRRGWEPRADEWAWQLRWWSVVLRGVERRMRGAVPAYEDVLVDDEEDPGVQETMYALWLMCLEDDGCNRVQMQLAGVYEWVGGYVQLMGRNQDELADWPVANAGNSCAMWIFWYLSSKERLLAEPEPLREHIVQVVLPFLAVPFRYPTAFAPPNHFRLPLAAGLGMVVDTSALSVPTLHGPYPPYHTHANTTSSSSIHDANNTTPTNIWHLPHYSRWVPLSTPLAADAAKLVYFSRRETMLFEISEHMPRTREEARAQAADGPRLTQQDLHELNAGLLGGEMVPPPLAPASSATAATVTATTSASTTASTSTSTPTPTPTTAIIPSLRSYTKGGGTPLPYPNDPWDHIRRLFPSLHLYSPDEDIRKAERVLAQYLGDGTDSGVIIDESNTHSKRWDADWWRLRLCRSVFGTEEEEEEEEDAEMEAEESASVASGSGSGAVDVDVEVSDAEDEDEQEEDLCEDEHFVDQDIGMEDSHQHADSLDSEIASDASTDDANSLSDNDSSSNNDSSSDNGAEEREDHDVRHPTLLTGYPQKGAVYVPGLLGGLWTGRMLIPSETHLRALLMPPEPRAPDAQDAAAALDGAVDAPAALAVTEEEPEPGSTANTTERSNTPAPASTYNIPTATNPAADTPPPPTQNPPRPVPFTEDTLGLAAVPLYVRLKEWVVYEGGRVVPCAGDDLEEDNDLDDVAGKGKHRQSRSRSRGRSGSSGPSGPSRSKSRARSTGKRKTPTDLFDQGLKDAWFPPNSTITPRGEQVRVVVEGAGDREYEYVAVDALEEGHSHGLTAEAKSKRKPGTWHDKETCSGCRAREEVLKGVRRRQGSVGDDSDVDADPSFEPDTDVDADLDLPSYDPSSSTLPPCTGIRDVIITGTTDTRHAEAWGDWTWQGRVRKWDGLVGIVRSGSVNPNAPPGARSNRGKIFFYGTLLGSTNLVGTWRVAHEDPRMPAYEGAFTLGKKEE
ncbi:hypothetical protein BDP27DRAFT_1426701 [Rhodocollybia butyracea]|uniref:F-box domain-containing protein n=1 Tax=Rhodocollybia butyracea TaxID=206335 RepID=A0A9P5PHR9_9AGAR|nr:hypothetical protein BDP27DRAFT_1426701 [Rhodocollybia butyracea]